MAGKQKQLSAVEDSSVRAAKYMRYKTAACQYGPTNTYHLSTPIGEMELTSCPKGIHTLSQVDSITDSNFSPDPGTGVNLISQLYQDNGYTYKPAVDCISWLKVYFSSHGNKKQPPPKICSSIGKEGSFTQTAWYTLSRKVPYGKTISYQSLGRLCGNERACRAIGQAMRQNPVQLVIPCHRVIQESGRLGNYSAGRKNKVKEWLLQHEGVLK